MRKSVTGAAILLLALGACRTATVETAAPASPTIQPAPLPSADYIPAGTTMNVQLNQRLDTRTTRVGDRFTATVVTPLVTTSGQVVVPAGSVVSGVVTGLKSSDRIGDPAAIRVNFDRLGIGANSYAFSADVVATDPGVETRGPRIGQPAAIGAAAGAILGAIVSGGELERILVGGALGAGVGTIIALGVGEVDAALPAGTIMTLRTTQPVALR
ncbi:MAG TPA: hypothetical protein VKZ58_01500 [Longimicrobiales bacterium]|nr:hypothetical protein [Longimicrobiales bacterium]